MPETIQCQYADYVLPPKPGLLDRLLLPIAESFNQKGYRVDRAFALITEQPASVFTKGLTLAVDAQTLNRKDPAKFEVTKCDYAVRNGALTVTVSLRELKPTPLQRWYKSLPEDTQMFIAFALIIVPGALTLFAWYVAANFPEPMWFWAWLGGNVRGLVGWSLFVLCLLALVWSYQRTEGSDFSQNTLGSLFGLLTVGAPMGWMMVSAPAQPLDGSPQTSVAYLQQLFSQWQTFAPLLAGLAPWAAMILKWLGWDMMASMIEMMGKKKDK